MTPAALAVDAGQTETRAALLDEAGSRMATGPGVVRMDGAAVGPPQVAQALLDAERRLGRGGAAPTAPAAAKPARPVRAAPRPAHAVPAAFEALRGGLVVSVQAAPGSPLRDPLHMAAIARAAELGGARGIRAEGAADVAAIKAAVSLPVIGLRKRELPGTAVYITPEAGDARELADELGLPLLADVDSVEAGVVARAAGAAAVATTLSGYTGGRVPEEPDVELVRRLAAELDCPVLAEGRYASPQAVRAAFEAGAFAVVVGTAIADPLAQTRRFAAVAAG